MTEQVIQSKQGAKLAMFYDSKIKELNCSAMFQLEDSLLNFASYGTHASNGCLYIIPIKLTYSGEDVVFVR